MKVIHVSSEVVPFSKTGGLADVCGALPLEIAGLGHEVSIITPKYAGVSEEGLQRVSGEFSVELSRGVFKFFVFKKELKNGVFAYLIDAPDFFDRKNLYSTVFGDYYDNYLRFAFFSYAAIKIINELRLNPDVVHVHDWQAALIPFLNRYYFKNSYKTVLTIHNLGYQGLFDSKVLEEINISYDFFTPEFIEFYGKVNFLKAGLISADHLTTVSKKYAEEIKTKEFGFGLEGVLISRSDRLTGILNGVDYDVWNPAKDPLIAENFDVSSIDKKEKCKEDLLKEMGFSNIDLKKPVLGIISRLAAQKGFDILNKIIEEVVEKNDLYLVILGTGLREYEEFFKNLEKKYPEKVKAKIMYNNTLAHKIEAGSDIFLMPSRYEPCGLNQIYSLKYGTIPVVRATGGLDDTIVDVDADPLNGNGFKFEKYDPEELKSAINRALSAYRDREKWRKMVVRAMKLDFSWKESAKKYVALYEKVLNYR